jgi:hypothetical protein
MASQAQTRIRKTGSVKTKPAPLSREAEILKEFESFFDRHIGAMTPSQLRQYKKRSVEILDESRSRHASVSVSTHEKEQSSLKVHAG